MTLRYGLLIATALPLAAFACGGSSTRDDSQPGAGRGGTGGRGGTSSTGGSSTTGGSGGTISSGGINTGGTGMAGAGTGGSAGALHAGSGGSSASGGNGGVAAAGQAGGGLGGQGGAGTSGNAGTAGSELGGEGGGTSVECPTDCEAQPSGLCGDDEITWVCFSAPVPDFVAAGCTDAFTQVPRFCCPSTFLPECQ
jgi:hypothetical protein